MVWPDIVVMATSGQKGALLHTTDQSRIFGTSLPLMWNGEKIPI